MATSLTSAKRNLEKAKTELAQRESRNAPKWFLEMFRIEVECCEAELRAWQR